MTFQDRVIEERDALATKLRKLLTFIDSDTFKTLPIPEQMRMTDQSVAMKMYLDILEERIAAFAP